MKTYAILRHPGHNRVYFGASRGLALIELKLTAETFQTAVTNIREETIGGVPYFLFDVEAALSADDLTRLARLSFTYALYELESKKESLKFTPLLKDERYVFDEDARWMLKYVGKTNEIFTRFLINLALCNLQRTDETALRILDPICGKATTLFDCLALGHHAYGAELDEKAAYEAYVFMKKYLETARLKHQSHSERTGGVDASGKKFSAEKRTINITFSNKTRAEISEENVLSDGHSYEKEKKQLVFEIIAGDSRYINTYYRKHFFDVLIGDLPYGVQHGVKSARGLTRNAKGMLTEALPEWLKVLRPGGVIVLSWNLFLIPRAEMEALFALHKLRLPEDACYRQMAHRVDQAIERDVIVGVKR